MPINQQDIKNAKLKAELNEREQVKRVKEMYYRMAIAVLTGNVSSSVVQFAEAVAMAHEKENPIKVEKKK